jgi:thiamine biosynthesis lipoprotein
VGLDNESLSVSAGWGRSFESDGKTYGHVIDPRTGSPTDGALLSAVVLPRATESDALSTALLIAPELMNEFISHRPALRCLLARGPATAPEVLSHALAIHESF